MKSVIESELNRVEERLFDVLEKDGISPSDAVAAMHVELDVICEKGRPSDDFLMRPGYFAGLAGIGMVRYMAEHEPDNPEAIRILCAVSEAVGFVAGLNEVMQIIKDSTGCETLSDAFLRAQDSAVKALASKAADARHTENREIAARIQAWYAENHHRYRSMDQAAEAVVKLEPVAWRTARNHIGAAAKKLRSARKE